MGDRTNRLYSYDHLTITHLFNLFDQHEQLLCMNCGVIGSKAILKNTNSKLRIYCDECLKKKGHNCYFLVKINLNDINFDMFRNNYALLNEIQLKKLYQIKTVIPDNDNDKYNLLLLAHLFNSINFIFIGDGFKYIHPDNPRINTGNLEHEFINDIGERSNFLLSLMFLMYALVDVVYFEDIVIRDEIYNEIVTNPELTNVKKIITYTLHACNIDIYSDELIDICLRGFICWFVYLYTIVID